MDRQNKRRQIKRPRYFLNHESVKEEMEEFMREWRIEKNRHGVFVPASALYNTSYVLRELVERGLLLFHDDGFAPN